MKIFIAKKGDRHADISELEKECDRLVWHWSANLGCEAIT